MPAETPAKATRSRAELLQLGEAQGIPVAKKMTVEQLEQALSAVTETQP